MCEKNVGKCVVCGDVDGGILRVRIVGGVFGNVEMFGIGKVGDVVEIGHEKLL